MPNYYSTRLAGDRLRRCYELASPRVRRYLDAEIEHVAARIATAASVLELGCGYGRVLARLMAPGRRVVGIDTAIESLHLARGLLPNSSLWNLLLADATALACRDAAFDAVVCIQNGICAFRCDQRVLVREALRVTRPGGAVLFSSYAASFWPYRLQWFRQQAAAGLVGEIDEDATHPGEIVCKDGFRAAALGAREFTELCRDIGLSPTLGEVDQSSVFCELTKPGPS